MFQSLGRARRWLLQESDDRRRTPRFAQPGIIAHYWDGSAPEARVIRDIGEHGAYICTAERWYPGTIIRLILQEPRVPPEENSPAPAAASICVAARVRGHGQDGVGVEFVFRDKAEQENFRVFLAAISPQALVAEMSAVPATSNRQGQALVEFALILPLVFLMAVNAVNFGGFLFAWITVAGAARSGAQYMIMSSASPGKATPATPAQITTLITNDVTSLLNRASLSVSTCTNSTTSANGCTTLIDPEAPSYTLATVDVTYTYQPFIALFSFPSLGISGTLPPTTIHRKVVMRMLQ